MVAQRCALCSGLRRIHPSHKPQSPGCTSRSITHCEASVSLLQSWVRPYQCITLGDTPSFALAQQIPESLHYWYGHSLLCYPIECCRNECIFAVLVPSSGSQCFFFFMGEMRSVVSTSLRGFHVVFYKLKASLNTPHMNYKTIACLFKKRVADKWLNKATEVVWDFKRHQAEHGLIYLSLQTFLALYPSYMKTDQFIVTCSKK